MTIQWMNKVAIVFLSAVLFLVGAERAFSLQDPVSMLKNVTDQVMSELNQNRAEFKKNPHKLYHLIEQHILPHVDFAEMGRWVAGRNAWKAADAVTQNAFIQEFKTLVIKSYGHSLLEYAGEAIEFLPLREAIGDKTRIQILSLVKESGKSPLHMNYHLVRMGDDWRVYDIIIEGVSIVQGYRAQFAEDIKEGGVAKATLKMQQHNHG